MSYKHRPLQLTYEPSKGWSHVVLYTEPDLSIATAGANGVASLRNQTPYVREWLDRLQPCEPNPLHTTLVPNDKIPDLFHPCVYDDKDSPSAVAGDGCVCFQTSYDPEFGLPVVADHHRTVTGNHEHWTYLTYKPLDLRPGDTFASLIIDRGAFWIRTADGVLSLLPEETGRGYGVGYNGGGPHELTRWIQKLLASDGEDTSANASSFRDIDKNLFAWVSSDNAKRTQELTLADLRSIQRG